MESIVKAQLAKIRPLFLPESLQLHPMRTAYWSQNKRFFNFFSCDETAFTHSHMHWHNIDREIILLKFGGSIACHLSSRVWNQTTWAWNPEPHDLLIVGFSRLCNLSQFRFPHLWNGDNKSTLDMVVVGIILTDTYSVLNKCRILLEIASLWN